jgi:hypothetical protein
VFLSHFPFRISSVFFLLQEPLSKHPDFFAASDRMTGTLRGPLLTAQREISALNIKRGKLQEKINANDEKQKTAFTVANNIGEKISNTAKKAGFVSNHAKLMTELSMVDAQIRDFKQVFGLEMFQIFVDLEDIEGWLPTVRDIRSIYDQCRRDVEKIQAKRKGKEEEIIKLGGTPMTGSSEASRRSVGDDDDDTKPSYFKDAALADAESDNYVSPAVPTANTTIAAGGGDPLFGYGSVAASTATTSQFADPFASSAPMPPSQDPFASSMAPAAVHDPFATASSVTTLQDPFANLQQTPYSYNEPFGGGGPSSSTSAAPPSNQHDPFAIFDAATQQSQQTDNPMFRY